MATSTSALSRFFQRHDLTPKKAGHAIEQDWPDVMSQREAWFASQTDLDPARLVFINGTWATTNMMRSINLPLGLPVNKHRLQ